MRHSLMVLVLGWCVGDQYAVQYRLNFVLQVVGSGVRLVAGVVAVQIVLS